MKMNCVDFKNICAWMVFLFMPVFFACDRFEDNPVLSDEVKLTASLSPVLSSVYTKGEIKSSDNIALKIGVAKVVGKDGNFDLAESAALPATMSAPSAEMLGLREIRFEDFQGFPNSTDKLYYFAWYPYHSDVEGQDRNYSSEYTTPSEGNGRTTVTFDIPDDASTDILYSDVASGTRLSGFNTMTFQHALVKYSIKAYAMESDDVGGMVNEVWGDIKSVTLLNMPSTCVLTLPTSSNDLPDVTYGSSKSSKKNLTVDGLNVENIPVGFSKATQLTYFLAPPPSDDVLKIAVTTEKVVNGQTQTVTESVEASIARDFQRGKHYQIYLRFTTHGIINAEIVAGEWIDEKEYFHVDTNNGLFYDLSEGHNANSYIVSSAYSYCFDATVRGNGYTGIAAIPGAASDVYKVGNPVTAEIIWTDLVSSTTENIADYFTLNSTIVEGRVFFNVVQASNSATRSLKKEGNVVIGVRDASRKLLWTWHIWLTDRPAEQGYKNGFTVQDRDLGATAYKPGDSGNINGLYYQWGRPTPLPLDKTVYKPKSTPEESESGTIYNDVVSFSSMSDVLHPIIERVSHPTDYYNSTATASDQKLTKHLWGWRTEADEYTKTIYDPCPPGYRVPSVKLWRDLTISNAVAENNNTVVKFDVDVNNVSVYYPMTGYYTALGTHQRHNEGAYMWAATFELGTLDNLNDDKPYALGFRLDETTTNNATDLKEMQTEAVPSSYAMPVRCVSRMSKAHVTNLSDYQTANSYIISKKGFYKFKATVRGNGIGQLVSPGSTSTIVLTEQLQSVDITKQLVKVEPLWWKPAEGTSVTPSFNLLNGGTPDAEGYVTFELDTFNEGNLILAGYDAKGDILWSWHLWFTDEPQMMKSNSFVVMDRNLGATHAPKSPDLPTGNLLKDTYGLYYQWGRKDPFVAIEKSADNQSVNSIYKYSVSQSNVSTYQAVSVEKFFTQTKDVSNKTVANSVINPTQYHIASGNIDGIFNGNLSLHGFDITANDNAIENQCFSTMVHPNERRSLWGYSASAGYGVTTTKTMYDPCPPGYIVAHYLVWTNTERNWNNLYYSSLDGGYIQFAPDVNNVANGFYTSHYPELFDAAWYPWAGYINGRNYLTDGLKEKGSVGLFHTSTPAGNSSRSLMYYCRLSGKVYGGFSGQAVDGDYYGIPSTYAYPVRCQKE